MALTWAETAIAARIGESRTIRNRAKGNGHRHGKAPGADWAGDIEAAGAEMAAAKGIGVYMPIATTASEDRDGDLGYGLHVRHSEREQWWADPTGADRPAFFVPQNALHPIAGLVIPRPVTLPSDWPTAYERNR